ncbi:MAG: hypothetical protein JXC85_04265 [Candidatus Aenigmarchaeota archaeon]|nr:hypothetical protein [Candidatus Aenigmarchaeota archaeon]
MSEKSGEVGRRITGSLVWPTGLHSRKYHDFFYSHNITLEKPLAEEYEWSPESAVHPHGCRSFANGFWD